MIRIKSLAPAHDDNRCSPFQRQRHMTIGTIILIIVILMLVGAFPAWPHSRQWGYGPSGALGTVLLILLILVLLGKI
jgi:hypothetical protein